MKKYLLFVLFVFVWNSSFAKDDSVFVKIQADTVQIWNTDVSANCASRFSIKTEITKNSIVVTECDTLGPLANCNCIYDLHASLTGLIAGQYSVVVYRQELKKYFYEKDTTIVIDSLEFTLGASSSLPNSVVSIQSACHSTSSIAKEETTPETFQLFPNYPNPFNPSTVISYQLTVGGLVTLKIYDVLGNEVATLVNEEQQAGRHSINFDTTNNNLLATNKLSSGIYYYRLTAGNFTETKGMIYLK